MAPFLYGLMAPPFFRPYVAGPASAPSQEFLALRALNALVIELSTAGLTAGGARIGGGGGTGLGGANLPGGDGVGVAAVAGRANPPSRTGTARAAPMIVRAVFFIFPHLMSPAAVL